MPLLPNHHRGPADQRHRPHPGMGLRPLRHRLGVHRAEHPRYRSANDRPRCGGAGDRSAPLGAGQSWSWPTTRPSSPTRTYVPDWHRWRTRVPGDPARPVVGGLTGAPPRAPTRPARRAPGALRASAADSRLPVRSATTRPAARALPPDLLADFTAQKSRPAAG